MRWVDEVDGVRGVVFGSTGTRMKRFVSVVVLRVVQAVVKSERCGLSRQVS